MSIKAMARKDDRPITVIPGNDMKVILRWLPVSMVRYHPSPADYTELRIALEVGIAVLWSDGNVFNLSKEIKN